MAEVKNTKEAPIRVIAGTFPAACGDYAKKLREGLDLQCTFLIFHVF